MGTLDDPPSEDPHDPGGSQPGGAESGRQVVVGRWAASGGCGRVEGGIQAGSWGLLGPLGGLCCLQVPMGR